MRLDFYVVLLLLIICLFLIKRLMRESKTFLRWIFWVSLFIVLLILIGLGFLAIIIKLSLF